MAALPRAASESEADAYAMLSADHACQIDEFCKRIRISSSDTERFELCEQMRNRLLDRHASLELLIATVDQIMCAECLEYKRRRDYIRQKASDEENEAWRRFIGIAVEGSKSLGALKTVSRIWGRKIVRHYLWGYKGQNFCNKARAAALAVSYWENEARVKLNMLTWRRAHQSRRRKIQESVNPIETGDLISLAAWSEQSWFVKANDTYKLPFRELGLEELPAGFGFDEFGLMVWEGCAISTPATGTNLPMPGLATDAPQPELDLGNSEAATLPGETFEATTDHFRYAAIQHATATQQKPQYASVYSGRNLRQRKKQPEYKDTPAHRSRLTKARRVTYSQKQCCPAEVPSHLLSALDSSSLLGIDLTEIGTPLLAALCVQHLQALANLLLAVSKPHSTIELHTTTVFQRRDANSRIGATRPESERPIHDRRSDEECRQQVFRELRQNLDRVVPGSHGEDNDRLVSTLLQLSKPPTTDEATGKAEALFLSGNEASDRVESGILEVPVITEGQQQFQWNGCERPIEGLFQRMVNLSRTVPVQIPSRRVTHESFELQELIAVQRRFRNRQETQEPWNILDLASPLPRSILPNCLMGPNCQLLCRIRDAIIMEHGGERAVASAKQWGKWREVEEWVLLAEGGHTTAPHTDSHGYSTWITVQEGRIGFGWMSRPSDQERDQWMRDPRNYTGGQWRYVILTPGRTVIFGPGTIHFVFRPRGEQTLALGGHILQWTGIEQWAKVVINQLRYPNTTNEDMKGSVPKYVRIVSELVKTRVEEDREEELGGKAVVDRYFKLVDVGFVPRR